MSRFILLIGIKKYGRVQIFIFQLKIKNLDVSRFLFSLYKYQIWTCPDIYLSIEIWTRPDFNYGRVQIFIFQLKTEEDYLKNKHDPK